MIRITLEHDGKRYVAVEGTCPQCAFRENSTVCVRGAVPCPPKTCYQAEGDGTPDFMPGTIEQRMLDVALEVSRLSVSLAGAKRRRAMLSTARKKERKRNKQRRI